VTALKIAAISDESTSEAPIDVDLLPSVKAVSFVRPDVADDRDVRHQALEMNVRRRIESRLLGRIRNLRVRSSDGLVVLEGECTTFYTKQLAQHAAMGVLEDEQLENDIVVTIQ
jgi:osmotically-inducible protein OsmY